MAVTVEELRAVMRMEMKPFMRDLQQIHGVSAKAARQMESTWRQANRRLDGIGQSMARSLTTPLAGVSAALGVREVLRYADAWTGAKNSLAVAGVVGAEQADVLDRLYNSAQANAAPVGALADLFGKAAQASDNLGASQAELLEFSDGVATSLRVEGKSAAEASGALTQLGQLLGQARVQAEEFNSINEGARPILMAVAHGLDEAGGSVSKLKALVNEGKVSGQQFFQAFLKGLPEIQKMAANATQTIEQGMTKVNNALTKYVGETDESLGASQRLVAGLNTLADNFNETADIVLQLASVIAGALVGRSLAMMIAKLSLGAAAIVNFVRAAKTMAGLSAAFAGLGAAAGPVGLLIGGTVVGALALFSSSSGDAGDGADRFAERLRRMGEAAEESADRTEKAGERVNEVLKNKLTGEVSAATGKVDEATRAVTNLFDHLFANVDKDTISQDQLRQLTELRDQLKNGSTEAEAAKQALYGLANANPNFQAVANAFAPLLDALAKVVAGARDAKAELASLGEGAPDDRATRTQKDPYIKAREAGNAFVKDAERRNSLTKDQLALETEIAKVRKEAEKSGAVLTEKQIESLAKANVAADSRRGAEGKKPKREREDDYERDVQRVIDHTAALVAETEAQRQVNPLVNDYGYAAEKARLERELLTAAEQAGKKVTPELRAEISALADEYATAGVESAKLAESQDELRASFEDMRDLGKNVMGGFIYDLKEGKSASEALAGALAQVGDKLLDIAMNSLFDGGGGFLSGLLGNLFGGGGPLTNLPLGVGLYDKGGYTGAGGKYTPAGVVHKGEYVFDQAAVQAAGGPAALEALRARLKGYAAGGFVGAPSMPQLVASGGGGKIAVDARTTIHAPNSDAAGLARLEAMVRQRDAELPSRIIQNVRLAQKRRIL